MTIILWHYDLNDQMGLLALQPSLIMTPCVYVIAILLCIYEHCISAGGVTGGSRFIIGALDTTITPPRLALLYILTLYA